MAEIETLQFSNLKRKVYRCWRTLHRVNAAYCPKLSCTEDERFKSEIRTYGDLRTRNTWEAAYSVLKAKLLFDSNDDNQFLIEFHLIRAPRNEGWQNLVPQVVDQFVAIPGGYDCLVEGFEQIAHYGSSYETTVTEVQEIAHATKEATRRRFGTAGTGLRDLPAALPVLAAS